MTNCFSVVGEHRDDPDRLLLLGEDGGLYDLPSPDREPTPTRPTDEWTLDPDAARDLRFQDVWASNAGWPRED
jgi:hypothetical protein